MFSPCFVMSCFVFFLVCNQLTGDKMADWFAYCFLFLSTTMDITCMK